MLTMINDIEKLRNRNAYSALSVLYYLALLMWVICGKRMNILLLENSIIATPCMMRGESLKKTKRIVLSGERM